MEVRSETYVGDCLEVIDQIQPESIDLTYIDPPFYTQKVHNLTNRDGSASFRFSDIWDTHDAYADFISPIQL